MAASSAVGWGRSAAAHCHPGRHRAPSPTPGQPGSAACSLRSRRRVRRSCSSSDGSGGSRESGVSLQRALDGVRWPLFGVAVGPIGRLLGSGEAEAAHSGIREAPAARPRRRDGEAHAAVRQPAAVALVQPGELPGGIEVPDLGHHGPAPPAGRMGFRQRQPPRHEEHVTWEPKQVYDRPRAGPAGAWRNGHSQGAESRWGRGAGVDRWARAWVGGVGL